MLLKNIRLFFILFLICGLFSAASTDRRAEIYRIGLDLEKAATYLAESSFEHFRGWDGTISDEEQAVLFKSEAFAASCRLFLKLAERDSDYFSRSHLRTNIYNAYLYLTEAFDELQKEMRRTGIQPYALRDARNMLERMDYEFSRWPSADNLAYLHRKYVKARDATVYMIERRGPGQYVLHRFKNLESLFRYNYDLKRGKNPWDFLVEVDQKTLDKMGEGPMIDLNFEGYLIIEQSTRSNRAVYLIENGKKRGITSPRIITQRFGGWDNVYEVPVEVIRKYPEGDPIK
ncbi:MAG: hypothetical protein PVF22_04625 [Candidatus Aminicenantes bacterium]|jgi:hypothetical protein